MKVFAHHENNKPLTPSDISSYTPEKNCRPSQHQIKNRRNTHSERPTSSSVIPSQSFQLPKCVTTPTTPRQNNIFGNVPSVWDILFSDLPFHITLNLPISVLQKSLDFTQNRSGLQVICFHRLQSSLNIWGGLIPGNQRMPISGCWSFLS